MEPPPAGVPRSATVRADATCDGISGNDGAIRTFAPANRNQRQCCEFLPPNTLRLSRAALLGADRTAARQPPRRTQTRPERTAAGVTPVQVGSSEAAPAAGPTNGAASACDASWAARPEG